jgi:hypothetical protein
MVPQTGAPAGNPVPWNGNGGAPQPQPQPGAFYGRVGHTPPAVNPGGAPLPPQWGSVNPAQNALPPAGMPPAMGNGTGAPGLPV